MARIGSRYLLAGSAAVALSLLLVGCLGSDDSGRPTAAELRSEAEPFIREFDGTALYFDRYSLRMLYITTANELINHEYFDDVAKREGWKFLREETRFFSSSRMYSKHRLCLTLEEGDDRAVISLAWTSNTRSPLNCKE